VSAALHKGLTCSVPGNENFGADIIFTSWRKDIDTINAGSDIIALTSINEGTPVSIIEALASGRAVICTDVGGIRDLVSDGESGMITRQDAVDFGNKLVQLVKDKSLRDRLAEKGKERV
jgi:glycosyltransferase involved in cell wall biosynthesis